MEQGTGRCSTAIRAVSGVAVSVTPRLFWCVTIAVAITIKTGTQKYQVFALIGRYFGCEKPNSVWYLMRGSAGRAAGMGAVIMF
jgi:hypothetical protein